MTTWINLIKEMVNKEAGHWKRVHRTSLLQQNVKESKTSLQYQVSKRVLTSREEGVTCLGLRGRKISTSKPDKFHWYLFFVNVYQNVNLIYQNTKDVMFLKYFIFNKGKDWAEDEDQWYSTWWPLSQHFKNKGSKKRRERERGEGKGEGV